MPIKLFLRPLRHPFQQSNRLTFSADRYKQMIMIKCTNRITADAILGEFLGQHSQEPDGLEARMHRARDHAAFVLVGELVILLSDIKRCDDGDALRLGFAEYHGRRLDGEWIGWRELGGGDGEEDIGCGRQRQG